MSGVPYVIEGSGSNERVYDLYSRLLRDRVVFLRSAIDEEVANAIVAQLLFLEADDPERDITIYINSPGGIASGALAIYDTINYIKPAVSTICIGSASSAAAFLLAAGAKGKRMSLHNSRVMIHQISSGTEGNIQDMRVHFKETERLNDLYLKEFSSLIGKSVNQLKKDMERDYFMSAEESLKYGIIDEILTKRG
jgi:ATP-dependent Clp protease protease subunit